MDNVVRFPNPLASGRHSWQLGNLTRYFLWGKLKLKTTSGEEQGVISSSLDFDQLALLILGFVKEVAQNNTSSFDISKFKAKTI